MAKWSLSVCISVTVFLKLFGLPPIATVPIAALVMFAAGYAFQRSIGNDFVDQPQHVQFVLYIGLALAITGLNAVVFGPDPRGIESAASFATYQVGPLRIDATRLHAAVKAPRVDHRAMGVVAV